MRARLFLCLSLLSCCPAPAFAQGVSEECPTPVLAPAPSGVPDPELLRSHRFATGVGVQVAVIDTGVAEHPRLGTVIPGGDLIGGGGATGALHDCDGHGTIVAGVIAARPAPDFGDSLIGVAPDAEIIAIRQSSSVLRSRGNSSETAGTIGSLAEAISLAVDRGADVINVSLASCIPEHLAGTADTSVLDAALHKAEAANVVVVAAAGNIGPACPEGSVSYPAASPTVLAVSASADSHTLAEYSLPTRNRPLSAPGSVLTGLSPTDVGFASAMNSQQGPRPFTGTSFAAPVVSGMAAQLKQRYPADTAAQIRAKLLAAASPGTGEIAPGSALMQLDSAPVMQQVSVKAPKAASTRTELRSMKVLLIFLGCATALTLLVAAVRTLRFS
ncbi:Minor extracellular protease Epr precursor [Corynebacterium kalinowskii]|uniref:Minor extracellular protease Epr n=1 Tax=Corynebacterium kalinowskii TaxID=2675216 RepID=A0A6B8VVX3_9CORY|nr:Minor extracellular protease Epr precursor [Corynebacterium kalinowskii]